MEEDIEKDMPILLETSENESNEQLSDIISSIPEIKQKIPPETIEFAKEKTKYLKPQENKFWRFTFKDNQNTDILKQNIESLDLTVSFDMRQNEPDITIKQDANIIGKVNLILSDRRDVNLPEKYYCKVYFYDFSNQELYMKIKYVIENFFNNLKISNTNEKSGKYKKHYTHKKNTHKNKNKNKNKNKQKKYNKTSKNKYRK